LGKEILRYTQTKINVLDLAGYISNLFEYEPINIFSLIDQILSEVPYNDWEDPIHQEDPKTLKPWIDYYRQSAMNAELLTIDDPV